MFFEDLADSSVGEYEVVNVTYFDAPGIEEEEAKSYVEEYVPVGVTCFDHRGEVLEQSGESVPQIPASREDERTTGCAELTDSSPEPPKASLPSSAELRQVGLESLRKLVVRLVFVPTALGVAEPCLL